MESSQNQQSKGKVWPIVILVLFIISVVVNLLLLITIGFTVEDYENELYIDSMEWCEFSNDMIDYSNDLLELVQVYYIDYEEIDYLESFDCWS